jgi:hypothetical protein
MRRLAGFALLAIAAFAQSSRPSIPTPEQFFGFRIGTDRKIARYDKIVDYLQKVAVGSDRITFRNLGPTTGGHPLVMLEISSPATIRNLDHYKHLEQGLYFQGGAPTSEEREQIFREGKAVVLITNNVHSTEIGSSQTAIELAYRLATEDSPAVQKILDSVILLLVPSANPDGQIMVTDWYNKYLGTPQEGTSPPFLYQSYAGHDDNRDMFLFSQKETQLLAQVLWHDWFPAIWLDQHQQDNAGARMFTMPAADPINPNVHPLIYRLNTVYGQMQAAALEAAGKDGIMHGSTYTSFWEGAMAWSGWWHNQVGLLTEAASVRIATPVSQQFALPGRPAPKVALIGAGPASSSPDQPLPPPRDVNPRSDYPRPWLGGTWSLRDIIDYESISSMALLESAADNRETLLRQIYDVNRTTIEAGSKGRLGFGDQEPEYAVIIPTVSQQDRNEVIELVDKLRMAGVEVYQSRQEFRLNGLTWAAGTYVIPFTQVFARYAKDLLETQMYPEAQHSNVSAVDAPYDVSAWSLGMQFGVKTVFAHEPLPEGLALDRVNGKSDYVFAAERSGSMIRFPYTGAESAVVVNRLLKGEARVSVLNSRVAEAPVQIIQVQATPQAWSTATRGFNVTMKDTAAVAEFGTPLRLPRVGLYQSWTANIDEGWTRWVFESYEFPYTTLHNADIQAGGLRAKFDAIVLPDQTAKSLMEGQSSITVPAEYRGGLGERGWLRLREFLDHGGTLISLGDASNLLVERLPLPVRDLKRTVLLDQHDGPGTILNLQVDTSNPIGWGMASDTFGFYLNSPFFQLTEGFSSQKARVVARYPNMGVVASGWMRGEEYMLGRAAVVAVDTLPGKVVLFGIRPQHRAQSHATLPLLFNSLYWSAEGDLGAQ